MKKYFLIFFLFSFFNNSNAQTFVVDTVYYHGNPDNRINLIIMGDGYQTSELNKFRIGYKIKKNTFQVRRYTYNFRFRN